MLARHLFVFALTVAAMRPVMCQAQGKDELVRGLEERGGLIKSLDVRWEGVISFTSAYAEKLRVAPFGDDKKTDRAPELPSQWSWTGRFAVAGDKLRFEHNAAWAPQSRNFQRTPIIRVFDGATDFTLDDRVTDKFPLQGYLRDNDEMIRTDMWTWPVLWQAQPLHPASSLRKILSWNPEFQQTTLDGVPLMIVTARLESDVEMKLWFDPSRQWSIVRYSRIFNGAPLDDWQITYSQDRTGIWIPSGWQIDSYNPRRQLEKSTQARVFSYQINEEPSADTFRLSFPEGTVVTDLRNGREQRFVMTSGELLPVERQDVVVAPTMERLIERAQTSRGDALRGRVLLALALLGIVGAVVVTVLYKRRVSRGV